MADNPVVDAVVIGRNEGARLLACINTLKPQVRRIVYVDSGSDDGSPASASRAGAHVINLNMTLPFTAARARNAGLTALEGADYVQFVDGDCIAHDHWVAKALAFLCQHPDVAVVCGRRREEHPERSVYNRLCDIEWSTPVGSALACGGDALVRVNAVRAAGGYRECLIAGEEPELCLRLRKLGWKIWRIDADMTFHDAKIHRFSQWAKRSRRTGHAFAEGANLHGFAHWGQETRRALVWGFALPLLIFALGLLNWLAWLLFLVYPLQIVRLAARQRRERAAWERAFFLVLGKFFEAWGALGYYFYHLRGRQVRLIEYK